MAASGKNNFGMKEKQVLSPIDGGKVDKIQTSVKVCQTLSAPRCPC